MLTYAANTWALTRTEKKKMDVLEMKMTRTIMGISWRDRVTNEDTLRRLQVPVSLRIRPARLKWFRQIERMEASRIPREVLEARMIGRRPRGRPWTRWDQVVERDIENAGVPLAEARGLTATARSGEESCQSHVNTHWREANSCKSSVETVKDNFTL